MTTERLDDVSPPALPDSGGSPGVSAAPAGASAEHGYRALMHALGVAVYVTDAEGRILDYNEAAADLWGRHPRIGSDQWCGTWRLHFPDGSPMAHDECPMAITLKEARPVRGGEAIAERPDGTMVPFMAFPTPLFDEAGALTGAVNVLVDITQKKSAENALQENQDRLTEALAAKDEFLGLVSHELRTPITMIMGNAEILARRPYLLDEGARQGAMIDIYQESLRLNRLVEDLLTLARLEQGRLESEPVSVTRVIESVSHEPDWRAQVHVSIAPDAGELIAYGDENLVRQVLRNYVHNARKYSSLHAPVEIVVEREEHEAIVRVLDRGMGVNRDELERLFEPFYRSRLAEHIGGLGIGLAVCRRLIEAVGGRVWAQPRPGGGSEFSFALVLCTEADD